ncbi:hypothetical protein PSY23_23640, partial [Shigella flexneri]|nr:hypothetical protein [Shigella flexneri]
LSFELSGFALFLALWCQLPPAGLIHLSARGSLFCAFVFRVFLVLSGLFSSLSPFGFSFVYAPLVFFWASPFFVCLC